jgi:GntR family histidine utilization transcriptional repressor
MRTAMNMRDLPKPGGPAAPYLRVKQHLRDGLAQGRWSPGEQMPSEAELTAQFGVSRMTVNRALRELQTEGMVERVQGVGTFAAQLHRMSSTLKVRDLHEEIEARGHRHHLEVHLQREERAGEALARQLGLPPGAPVFHSIVVHFDNGEPLQCEDRFVHPERAPGYLEVDFTQTTPTQHLLEVAPFWEAQFNIQAGLPTAQEARLLGLDPASPCLIVVRRTANRDSPVTLVRLVHPGSRYQIEGKFAP